VAEGGVVVTAEHKVFVLPVVDGVDGSQQLCGDFDTVYFSQH
jgi:shikimate 5-dehydrogenase